MWRAIIVGAFFLSASPAISKEVVRISIDRGGNYHDYIAKINSAKGKLVMIDGDCQSACALYFHSSFQGQHDLCATDNARLGFHKPYTPDQDGNPLRGEFYLKQTEEDWYIVKGGMPQKIWEILDFNHVYIPNPTLDGNTQKMFWIGPETLQSIYGKCS